MEHASFTYVQIHLSKKPWETELLDLSVCVSARVCISIVFVDVLLKLSSKVPHSLHVNLKYLPLMN